MARRSSVIGASLAVVLLATAAAAPAIGAQSDRRQRQNQEEAAVADVSTLGGKRYRMAKAKMASRVTRIADAAADQVTVDGAPAPGAPAHTDIAAVYVAPVRMPKKLLTRMGREYPPGVVGAFYGAEAKWKSKDRAVFIAVELGARRPDDALGQQVEVGLGGNDATPLHPGSSDRFGGLERFSLAGVFNNGAWSAGTTDISERQPGEPISFYNSTSGDFGFYDRRAATWYMVVPRAGDVGSVTVSLRSSTEDGEVIDDLVLPAGGRFIDLADPTGGFDGKAASALLTCRAIEAAGAGTVDPEAALIRYTVGARAGTDPEVAEALLAAAAEAEGSLEMTLSPVGTDDEEPITVPADLALSAGGDSATLTMEVPPGRWLFAPATAEGEDGAADGLRTPAGEPLIEHISLTGHAGVLADPELVGVIAGDPTCGAPAPA